MTDLLLISIILLAAVVQGFFGYGYALVSMPLLTLVMHDAHAAVVFSTLTVVCHTLTMLPWAVKHTPWDSILWPSVGVVAGVIVGVLAFRSVDNRALMLILGSALIFISCWKLSGRMPHREEEARGSVPVSLLCGGLSGGIGALVNASGPPLLIYGSLRGWRPIVIKAFAQPIFLIGILCRIIGYSSMGYINRHLLFLAACSAPLTIGVTLLSLEFGKKVTPVTFEKVFYCFVLLIGIVILGTSIR